MANTAVRSAWLAWLGTAVRRGRSAAARVRLNRSVSGRSVGRRGERIAARYLVRQGYRVLAHNLETRLGEIDILAEAPDGRAVVVVEVKARLGRAGGVGLDGPLPEARVGYAKQRKLTALAVFVARRYQLSDRPMRFDVIGVDLGGGRGDAASGWWDWLRRSGRRPVVRHHVGAFEAVV